MGNSLPRDILKYLDNILMRCGADYDWAGAIRLGVSSASSTAQVINNVIHGAIGPVGVFVIGAAPVYSPTTFSANSKAIIACTVPAGAM
jgi:hypothetical protein